MPNTVFTIGHSTHTIERFVTLLKNQDITALCDVRSMPYSRFQHQFNRENLKKSLEEYKITYVFLGKELGARTNDPTCYDHGKVQYSRLAQTKLFQIGLERIREGMKQYTIVLMCAEKEPLDCHRTILISRYLNASNIEVQHIHADGHLESQERTIQRLLYRFHLPENHMFRSREEILSEAYSKQEERIAYVSIQDPQGENVISAAFSS
jgi:uncharacterized protein (DUF488 family)